MRTLSLVGDHVTHETRLVTEASSAKVRVQLMSYVSNFTNREDAQSGGRSCDS